MKWSSIQDCQSVLLVVIAFKLFYGLRVEHVCWCWGKERTHVHNSVQFGTALWVKGTVWRSLPRCVVSGHIAAIRVGKCISIIGHRAQDCNFMIQRSLCSFISKLFVPCEKVQSWTDGAFSLSPRTQQRAPFFFPPHRLIHCFFQGRKPWRVIAPQQYPQHHNGG